MLIVANEHNLLIVSGNGEVIEPDDGIAAIGSGGPYALAAAKALVEHSDLDAAGIARTAMEIAGSICVYTNSSITLEEL
jgi:ATP-dependent HslUV protease subunit HslV